MKKLILLAISQLLFCSMLFAQTDNPGCYFLSTVSDASCDTDTSCGTATHCTSSQFSVSCSGTIRFKAYTSCSGTNCAHCASCVTITTTGGLPLLSFDTDGLCTGGGFCALQSLYLGKGNYVMKVCLIPCNAVDTTPCCNEGHSCTAWGVASSDPLSCPANCP